MYGVCRRKVRYHAKTGDGEWQTFLMLGQRWPRISAGVLCQPAQLRVDLCLKSQKLVQTSRSNYLVTTFCYVFKGSAIMMTCMQRWLKAGPTYQIPDQHKSHNWRILGSYNVAPRHSRLHCLRSIHHGHVIREDTDRGTKPRWDLVSSK